MMNFFKRLIVILIIIAFVTPPTFAETFVVHRIQIQGLQHINQSTVLNYLPVRVGQSFNTQNSAAIIQALYRTGFFSDVQILRSGDTLILRVKEQPVIGLIRIKGNKAIPTKKLQEALKKLNIMEGQVFDSVKLHEITEGLKQQYDLLGLYSATVDAQVGSAGQNRVAIDIHINEGPIAKISEIKIEGDRAFSQRALLKNFHLTTRGPLTYFTHSDRYSKAQFDQDLENLRLFYLDHGYLQFRVVSQQVTMSPDNKSVHIVIEVNEGPVYQIRGYEIVGSYANNPDIQHIVSVVHDEHIFSRADIMKVNQSVAEYFQNKGYAFPQVNVNYKNIDEVNHTVFLIFSIEPGHYVYVRQINFVGNHRTRDLALRSQMQQMEAGVFSLQKINESKRRLANLPYLQNIQVEPNPVAGHPDQVDLNYHVTEINAGRASVQGGYSDVEGIIYGANLSEPNFMGTGKYVSLGFTKSQAQGNYQFSYNNPYYTINGISRGFDLYYTNTTRNRRLNQDTYTMDDFGGDVNYGIPVSTYDTLSLGYGYDNISLGNIKSVTSSSPPSPQILLFTAKNKSPFSQFNLLSGLTHSTLDRAVFPTSGTSQTLGITTGMPIIQRSVGYYKATYNGSWYMPLGYGFILSPHATLGYGGGYGSGINSALPFYNNFYAGGIDTVPGFEPNSLGPVNPNNGRLAMGGNTEIVGGINFIFPNHISEKLRTAITFNAGNVFQTNHFQYSAAQLAANPGLQPIVYDSISLRNLRSSVGIMISWYSPLGPIEFSLATPISKKKGDQTSIFGFSFGGTL